jgi:hypothetical protein
MCQRAFCGARHGACSRCGGIPQRHSRCTLLAYRDLDLLLAATTLVARTAVNVMSKIRFQSTKKAPLTELSFTYTSTSSPPANLLTCCPLCSCTKELLRHPSWARVTHAHTCVHMRTRTRTRTRARHVVTRGFTACRASIHPSHRRHAPVLDTIAAIPYAQRLHCRLA